MPWKRCPKCGGASYSAVDDRDEWPCPYCGAELASTPDVSPPDDLKPGRASEPPIGRPQIAK